MKLTTNFQLKEFINSRFFSKSQQKKVWLEFEENKADLLPKIQKLANQLQVLRTHFDKPITINISYRPLWYELLKGRSGNSKHTLGIAVDFNVKDTPTSEVREAIESLIASGDMLQGGLGKYDSFIHYDIRGVKARW